MNIDITNYEEYFLLFTDNELSEQERNEVMKFVESHPDLKEEFDMIASTVFLPEENISLKDKSVLYRESEGWINMYNYEEKFILFHDEELDALQKAEVYAFLNDHPQLNEAFLLYSEVKLQPEKEIIFPGKQKLYRHEKSGKVIPMMFWRIMAAALVLGFGFWIFAPNQNGIEINTSIESPSELASNSGKAPISPSLPAAVEEKSNTKPEESIGNKHQEPNSVLTKNDNQSARTSVVQYASIKEVKDNKAASDNNSTIENHAPELGIEKTVKPLVNSNPILAGLEKQMENKSSQSIAIQEVQQSTAVLTAGIENNESKHPLARFAAIEEDNSNKDYIFYNIPVDEFNKSKVGAFLKKVKRIVDRNDPLKRLIEGEEKQVVYK